MLPHAHEQNFSGACQYDNKENLKKHVVATTKSNKFVFSHLLFFVAKTENVVKMFSNII